MKNKFLFILLFTVSFAHAADSLVLQIPVSASFFTTDHLQNIYYVNAENEVVKYDWQTKKSISYSNKLLGKPTYIDASNPLKILVLYPDFNTVCWLSNTMSAIQALKLNQLPGNKNYLATALCAGQQDNMFWIFDALSNKLLCIDEQGNTLYASETFTDMFTNAYQPLQLLFQNNTLYVNCSGNEILVFDVFANYVSTIQVESEGYVQIIDKNIIFLKSQMLHITNTSLHTAKNFTLPLSNILQLQVEADKLYVRTQNNIQIFSTPQ